MRLNHDQSAPSPRVARTDRHGHRVMAVAFVAAAPWPGRRAPMSSGWRPVTQGLGWAFGHHHEGGGGHNPDGQMIAEGLQTFRYDTFGDEAFWGGEMRLHEAVATLSPEQALGLGLKVDSDSLDHHLKQALRHGRVDLGDPAVTLELLRRNAVVGVTGFFSHDGRRLVSFGIQCALCHSVVDDSLAPGIGRRLDGWANRDLNVGAIVAAAPTVKPFADVLGVDEATVRTVLKSWGPGKFDAELILDGKAFRPDGKPGATLIPPAFGMAGITSTPGPAGGRSPTGTPSSPTWRCTARGPSRTRG